MSTSGTPAGWYPDPENPGQTRYWDGAAWAAPTTPPPGPGLPPTAPPPGGGTAGKNVLIIVAVIAVLALVGGGAWALLGGDDDGDGKEEVSTDDDEDDDEGDDAGDVEELSADEFAERANQICSDLEDDLDELFESTTFGEGSTDLADEARDLSDGPFDDLRAIAPDGEVDEWEDMVDEWQSLYSDLFDAVADDDFEVDDLSDLQSEYDDLASDLGDFGVDCLEGGGMTAETGDGAVTESPGGTAPSSGGSSDVEQSQPTDPPLPDDPDFIADGEECYRGDMEACNRMFRDSGVGSPEEDYGYTCGGRVEPGEVFPCTDIENPTLP